ncbi:MAG: Uncharacterized protein FD124_3953, partial [Alphaproteobacteria bacterium]
MRLEIPHVGTFADGVATAKLGTPLGENRLVTQGAPERRLVRGGPESAVRRAGLGGFRHGTSRYFADVAEGAPVVAGRVFAPARHGKFLPAAVAAARIGHHHVIAAVRQQLHFRDRRIGAAEYPDRRFLGNRHGAHFGQFRRMRKERRGLGNALLEQQHDGLEQAIGLEAPLHRAVEQQIGQREQAHALMVSHERAHHRIRLPAALPRRRVVDRFEETVPPDEAVV